MEQFLKVGGERKDQTEEEVDIKVLESNDMLFKSSEAAKKYIKKMIREYDSRSYVGVRDFTRYW